MTSPVMLFVIGAGCTLGIPALLWLVFGWHGAAAYWALSLAIGAVGWKMFDLETGFGLFTMWPFLAFVFATN